MVHSLEVLRKSKNIAELLDDDELAEIGAKVKKGYEIDEDSRAEWLETVHQALAIAKQTKEVKNTPWVGASNIKYPLITQAAEDYASRTFPQVIQNDRVVKAVVIGEDQDEEKYEIAGNIEKYMSFQLLHESDDWEEGTDKLLKIIPVLGTVFRKTYYDTIQQKVVIELCIPDKVVVNYNAQSLDAARRVTHILEFYQNDIMERMAAGLYREIDIETLQPNEGHEDDCDAPIDILEQHTYLDLDDDGYKEPYIVTVHKTSGEVLRIVNRFEEVKKTSEGKILRIKPIQQFVDFHFIRSPDGGFYSLGFGSLLLPLNAAINTLINQLVDAGTLYNTQGGLIGRGLRIKNGEFSYKMGEWKVVDSAAGTDLASNVFPMPVKEPSMTLFQLLQLLLTAGKDLSSTSDLMQGKQPVQNVAQGTLSMLIEQGTKIFAAINKRLYRSLRKEYRKLFELNYKFLTNEKYQAVLDNPAADVKHDFSPTNFDVMPVADPNLSTAGQRIIKAQAVSQTPGVNPYEAAKYQLTALQMSKTEIEALLPKPDPDAPPPPEQQKLLAEADLAKAQAQKVLVDAKTTFGMPELKQLELQLKVEQQRTLANESEARIMKMKEDAMVNRAKLAVAGSKADHKAMMDELDAEHGKEKDALELAIKAKKIELDHVVDKQALAQKPKKSEGK